MRPAAFVAVVVLVASPWGRAGDMDTHLTATHFLARYAGFDQDQARLIARANWSLDHNARTTATPLPGLMDASSPTSAFVQELPRWAAHGTAYHAFGTSRQEVRANLAALEGAVEAAPPDRRMIFLGQYLHALQDVFFHQSNGRPYTAGLGHLGEGPRRDEVALHFGSAARALYATHRALVQFRREGTLPDPFQTRSEAYFEHEELLPADIKITAPGSTSVEDRDKRVVLKLAAIMALAPPRGAPPALPLPGRPVAVPLPQNPGRARQQELGRALDGLGGELRQRGRWPPAAGSIGALVTFEAADRIPYDERRDLIAVQAQPPMTPPDPGGVSLSAAAALALPLDIDLDAVHFDPVRGVVTLAGRERERGHAFDAALFLTTLRLACEPEDPYFSLDPSDVRAYETQVERTMQELGAFVSASPSRFTSDDLPAEAGRFRVVGPEFESASLEQAHPGEYADILARFPALSPRLVFRPVWLGQTRVGRILYAADVLLKELSEGLPALDPGREPPALGLVDYVPPERRRVTEDLLRLVAEGGALQGSMPPLGVRLWFDLAEDAAAPPAPTTRRTPAPPVSPMAGAISRRIHASAVRQGVFAAGPASPPRAPSLEHDGDTMDLSQVVPRMFVRRHEQGRDVPGADPFLGRLAADVNARFGDYAARYQELRDLLVVVRAYVAARKIVEGYPALCAQIGPLPLLHRELLPVPLPPEHTTPLLAIHAATADYIYTSRVSSAGREGESGVARAVVFAISGGVGLGYGALRQAGGVTRRTSSLIADVRHDLASARAGAAVWQRPGSARRLVRLSLDARASTLRQAPPVTIAQALGPDWRSLLELAAERDPEARR